MKRHAYRYETVEEYLDRGGCITVCPPTVARNYLTDDSLVHIIAGESLADSQRTPEERAASMHEVRIQHRDQLITDAEWN